MKILLTGATGYIGKRLLPVLVDAGHHVICCVRDRKRFCPPPSIEKQIQILELDLLRSDTLDQIPKDIDIAYYLVHSMSNSRDYSSMERSSATNFTNVINRTDATQVIFLSGIINDVTLSKHLSSRKDVEIELSKGKFHLTTLRAGIIIGSGSASFEIIRDLVEKLPLMIAPKWLKTKCQPIGIRDVIKFLYKSIGNPQLYDKSFDIGGSDILTYKDILLEYAKMRGLRRRIFVVPFLSTKLSSYWLYFLTSVSYKLASSLVQSLSVRVTCLSYEINRLLDIKPCGYHDCLQLAFMKIQANAVVSSWKDSYVSSGVSFNISDFIEVPNYGCLKDKRSYQLVNPEETLNKIWAIGGNTGWYFGNTLWRIRGFLDELIGGVGLRRGRTNIDQINTGDAIDFWRVLYADKYEKRLLLFAEMKLPGEAWLEFNIVGNTLTLTATFRPLGLLGRAYWYAMIPFHAYIFGGMLRQIGKSKTARGGTLGPTLG